VKITFLSALAVFFHDSEITFLSALAVFFHDSEITARPAESECRTRKSTTLFNRANILNVTKYAETAKKLKGLIPVKYRIQSLVAA
jgi:hypothetical protein